MHLTPLACTAVWYCQPEDWEHLKEDLPGMQQSNKFIDRLLVSLHDKCIGGEKQLFDALTGSGNLNFAQIAFSIYEKKSRHGQYAANFEPA